MECRISFFSKTTNFYGHHTHVFASEPNLNNSDDDFYNDKASSLIVVESNWETFDNSEFDAATRFQPVLGPGLYPWVEAVGIVNDRISSLRPTRDPATVVAPPLDNHILLFEHTHFRGAHKHVFTTEANLNGHDGFGVSSLAVPKGNWAFYGKPGLDPKSKFPNILGPGGYPSVSVVGIPNDQLSSLQPVTDRPTVEAPRPVSQGVVLFIHKDLHGGHKHVIDAEPHLKITEAIRGQLSIFDGLEISAGLETLDQLIDSTFARFKLEETGSTTPFMLSFVKGPHDDGSHDHDYQVVCERVVTADPCEGELIRVEAAQHAIANTKGALKQLLVGAEDSKTEQKIAQLETELTIQQTLLVKAKDDLSRCRMATVLDGATNKGS